jgi:hypothetical protein
MPPNDAPKFLSNWILDLFQCRMPNFLSYPCLDESQGSPPPKKKR